MGRSKWRITAQSEFFVLEPIKHAPPICRPCSVPAGRRRRFQLRRCVPSWHHNHPNTLMERLWELVLTSSAYATQLRALVTQVLAPLVAAMLGYSYQVPARNVSGAGAADWFSVLTSTPVQH